jgi:tRNA/rRNA methyltransferase
VTSSEVENVSLKGAPAEQCDPLQTTPAVILVRPQLGENIGTAARAMANFGLADLRIVAPRDGWPNEAARAAAASTGCHVVDGAHIFENLEQAINDLHFLAATTARPRDMVKPVIAPETAIAELSGRMTRGERCGVLFGPERSGLDNDQMALADVIISAPVDPTYASLNLAQAVLILGYEWIKARGGKALGRETAFDGPAREGLDLQGQKPATKAELLGLFEHLEGALDMSGFLYPPEKRPAMVRNIRNMFQRMGATEQEVRTLRGIVAALESGHKNRGGTP